ncbi:hypothetical protein [Prochlorococcus sp. MIT 1341]|uniref:hypothetical protein n=1 Tax=Prochlorococcus sp. MIT 1341 TaxID=3096221 RepID=UPI002A761484|nr:hypothetical protein [Prochlorococcus sp. MIT 1341]
MINLISQIPALYRPFKKMPFGLSRKQIISWGLLATGLKVAFGAYLFSKLGLHLPWSL